MSKSLHRVELEKESLIFSAAHFITFGDNICERLHGHNYGVRCVVEGPLNEHGYVVDFIALRDKLASITQEMDHRVLLPSGHPSIRVSTENSETTASFEDRRWVFPKEDCLILPIANTTAELLAQHILNVLLDSFDSWGNGDLTKLIVSVDENQGQWGEVEKVLV